jgi:hypothetical protein
MSKVFLSEEQYANLSHCSCSHKPYIEKEFRGYGVITGTKFNYYVRCRHCKKHGPRVHHYDDKKAINKAIKMWNERIEKE